MPKHRAPDAQLETLEDLSEAVNYNHWIYKMLSPYLGQRILEIGCGTGNITASLASHGKVLAVDTHPGYLAEARRRFPNAKNVTFHRVNLEKQIPSLRSFHPDTIVCVNVLEHLSGDDKVLSQCLGLLPKGGRFLVFVPALQALFGSMDVSYGHYRRYSLGQLADKMRRAGFEVEYCRYLNLLGVFGWWLNGKVLKRKVIPRSQILIYDRVVWLAEKMERFLPKPIGVSLLGVGRKP